MIKTYSHQEMLKIWRRNIGLEPLRADCTIEAYEGIEINDIIGRRMRKWYLELLDTAPAHLLPLEDVGAQSSVAGRVVSLPANARRPLSVKLKGWPRAALIAVEARPARISPNYGDISGRRWPTARRAGGVLEVSPEGTAVESLVAVVDPGPDTYILDESLLPFSTFDI